MSSTYCASLDAKEGTGALLHPNPDRPFAQIEEHKFGRPKTTCNPVSGPPEQTW